MSKKVLVLMAEGCEEIETVTVIDLLRRASAEVVVAGLTEGPIKGANGVRFMPDRNLDGISVKDFDLIVLPGGGPGVDRLRKDARVKELLLAADQSEKLIGAICAAPLVLSDAGMLQDKKVTSYPGVDKELKCREYSTELVVEDGRLITSRAPGTAIRFSLRLIEKLFGKAKSDEISRMTLTFDQRG